MLGFIPFALFSSTAEVELHEGQRTPRLHGEAACGRVHGEERQCKEFPLKDPGC